MSSGFTDHYTKTPGSGPLVDELNFKDSWLLLASCPDAMASPSSAGSIESKIVILT